MNRTTFLFTLIVFLALQVVAPVLTGGGAENLLANPGFEGDYAPFGAFGTALVAEGWTPWWQPQSARDPAWQNRMPEFKPAAPYQDRIRSGQNAQQLFTAYGTHIGGVYQIVEVTQQLRGECGKTQVQDAHIGMAQNIGGSGASILTHILRKD